MTKIIETLPDDNEIEELTNPKNMQAAKKMEQKRTIKRKLDDFIEQMELNKALGTDF